MLKTIGALLFVSLRAATVNEAQLLGMGKSLGAIRPGFLADIAAVEGDPLADIEVAIQKARWVMKGGGGSRGSDEVGGAILCV